MIGTVVQNKFLVQFDYPLAAALSLVLMAIITVMVLRLLQVPGHGRAGRMTDRRPHGERPP